ncbi:chemotaxis protein CheA [Candidatus Methylospira mobilis]|uniref:Chemotaxis protein CheA n=1 Tax=Candidatus Methylospira mobilis TaxID=1808979 RepID=A0A5Q0BJI4_9GAMM|nr:chemotaxis protein CheA [Candidatus Methylospira mobilis]QFY43292.1 chemotaxis protein CheA [Candidatus Methylospira mobilis]
MTTDKQQANAPEKTPSTGEAAFLRVEAEKVDRLMDLVSELSLSVSEAVHSPDLEGLELSEFEKSAHRLNMVVREVQDAASGLRMVQIEGVFKRMRRMVRELERQTEKKIELVLVGETVEIDKIVADRLYDPLVHVVRNSADHGLESPQERIVAGKPETGRITLTAEQLGGDIQITISDDGRGLNRAKILARARSRGLFGADEEPSDNDLWKVIFQPGFSTAETVTNISGRGVGMDVLNTTMKELRGRIAVHSEAGKGSRVVLSIPLSLAFLDSLIMRVGARLYAVPVEQIGEVFRPLASQTQTVSAEDHRELVRVRERLIPVCRLQQFYQEVSNSPLPALDSQIMVVLTTAAGPVGLTIDEIYDQQQVVMKPLPGPLAHVRASVGCALLGTGEVAIVLDCEQLAQGVGIA